MSREEQWRGSFLVRHLKWTSNRTYTDLVAKSRQGFDADDAEQIAKDVNSGRSSAEVLRHTELGKTIGKVDEEKVARLLSAFCVYNPETGYCQGMNYLAVFALSACEEETAFWVFCTIVQYFYPADYFLRSSKLIGMHIEIEVLVQWGLQKLTKLVSLVGENEFRQIVPLLAYRWFACFFVDEIPPSCLTSLWDHMLLQLGSSQQEDVLNNCRSFLLKLSFGVLSLVENQFCNQSQVDFFDGGLPAGFAYYPWILQYVREISLPTDFFSRISSLSSSEYNDLRIEISYNLRENLEVMNMLTLTGLEEKELKRLYKEFHSLQQGRNSVDKSTFVTVMQRVRSDWKESDCVRWFCLVDSDGSDSVDYKEMMMALALLCAGTTDHRIQLCFNLYDRDGSNYLERSEIERLAKNLFRFSSSTERNSNALSRRDVMKPAEPLHSFAGHPMFEDDSTLTSRLTEPLMSAGQPLHGRSKSAIPSRVAVNLSVNQDRSPSNSSSVRLSHKRWLSGFSPEEESHLFVLKLLNMDTNQDGKVSLEEFKMGVQTDIRLLQCFQFQTISRPRHSLSRAKLSINKSFHGPIATVSLLPDAPPARRLEGTRCLRCRCSLM